MGPRILGPRELNNHRNYFRPQEPNDMVETWDNTIATTIVEPIVNRCDDSWGDWDNEEYTGSLTDSKVFTPSTVQTPTSTIQAADNVSITTATGLIDPQVLNQQSSDDIVYNTTVITNSAVISSVNSNPVQYTEILSTSPSVATVAQHLRQNIDIPQLNSSASLSAEQSQYFNSLTSQNSSAINSYQV